MASAPRPLVSIAGEDIVSSVADALQFIACYHPGITSRISPAPMSGNNRPPRAMPSPKSRQFPHGRARTAPHLPDTGLVVVFAKVGMDVRIDSDHAFADLIHEAVRRAIWMRPTAARLHGGRSAVRPAQHEGQCARRGPHRAGARQYPLHHGGGEGRRLGEQGQVRHPRSRRERRGLGAQNGADAGGRLVPAGVIGLGIGGSAEKAMLIAKEALMEEIDMTDLLAPAAHQPIGKHEDCAL